MPIFGFVKGRQDATGATVSVIYVPPPAPPRDLGSRRGRPRSGDLHHRRHPGPRHAGRAQQDEGRRSPLQDETLLLGPNCPGLITPTRSRSASCPGSHPPQGPHRRRSRSGTLTYLKPSPSSPSSAWASLRRSASAATRSTVWKHIDVMRMFNDDPDTDAVIVIGESAARTKPKPRQWCKANMKKPMVGFIAGVTAPAGKRMGHACWLSILPASVLQMSAKRHALPVIRWRRCCRPPSSSPAQVLATRPDVIFGQADSPAATPSEHLAIMNRDCRGRVLMCSPDSDSGMIRPRGKGWCVVLYVIDSVSPERLDALVEVAVAQFEAFQNLRAERDDATASRPNASPSTVPRRVLMRARRLDEDGAYHALRKLAMERGPKPNRRGARTSSR